MGLFAPCNIAVEIIPTSMLIADSVRISSSVWLAKFDRKTVGMPHYARGRPKDDGKSQRKAASSGSARVVRSLSWLPTATKIAAVASPISNGNSERMALPNGCVFFAC